MFFQDVEPNSPADLAGLKPYSDYIVGADQVLQEVRFVYQLFVTPQRLHLNMNENLMWNHTASNFHSRRISFRWSRRRREKRWRCWCTTRSVTAVGKWWSLLMERGAEREGTSISKTVNLIHSEHSPTAFVWCFFIWHHFETAEYRWHFKQLMFVLTFVLSVWAVVWGLGTCIGSPCARSHQINTRMHLQHLETKRKNAVLR